MLPRNSVTKVFFIFGLSLVLWMVVIIRLFSIQIWHRHYYVRKDQHQSQRVIKLAPKRGEIYDRNMQVLVQNSVEALEPITQALQSKEGYQIYCGQNGEISFIKGKRVYPKGTLAGPVIGFIGKDGNGLEGIEYYYDEQLRGREGWMWVRQDGKNRLYPSGKTPEKYPVQGKKIVLTLDAEMQAIVEEELKKGIDHTGAKGGMAILLNPQDGEILAMANFPSFNPNDPSTWQGQRNKTVNLSFEPGSTFKIITAALILEKGLKQSDDLIYGHEGQIKIYDQEIHDYKKFGYLTFREAMMFSSNICFAVMAQQLENVELYKYARAFGFGSETGIFLPGEEKGILRPLNEWSGRTRVTMSFGHEISVTTLQAAVAYAAIANGGLILMPRLVKYILDENGQIIEEYKKRSVRQVIQQETAQQVTEFMVNVVEKGTGIAAQVAGLRVAGKTGTAEKVDAAGGYIKNKFFSSFVGFLPAQDPRLLGFIVLDEPRVSYHGGESAAPVFREVMTRIVHSPSFSYGNNLFVENQPIQEPADYSNRRSIFEGEEHAQVSAKSLSSKSEFKEPAAVFKDIHQKAKDLTVESAISSNLITTQAVPPIVGLSMREAIQVLSRHQISFEVKGTGIVVRQSPLAGEKVSKQLVCMIECQPRN